VWNSAENPTFAQSCYEASQVYSLAADDRGMIKLLRAAIEAGSTDAMVFNNLGYYLLEEARTPAEESEAERLLVEAQERSLAVLSSRYPEVVSNACAAREPHQLINYLRELATEFHAYYNAHKFIVDDAGLRDARLLLVLATKQVLHNGLRLLGVSAPETM